MQKQNESNAKAKRKQCKSKTKAMQKQNESNAKAKRKQAIDGAFILEQTFTTI
jgi:hypothetical protein